MKRSASASFVVALVLCAFVVSVLAPRETAFAHADAITHFARALGAARSGNPAAAANDVEKLVTLRDALQKANDAHWTGQVDVQRRIASAWIALAEGAGERQKAHTYPAKLIEICQRTDKPGRPELQEAQKLSWSQ